MKACVVVVLLAVVALGAANHHGGGGHGGHGGHGHHHHHHHHHQQVCKGEQGQTEAFKVHFGACKQYFEGQKDADHKTKMENFGKFMLCMWEQEGIFDGHNVHSDKFIASTKRLFPTHGEELGKHVTDKCFKAPNTENLSKDNIMTFKSIFMCVMGAWGEVCPEAKKGPGMGGHKKVCNGEEGKMEAFMADAAGCKEHFKNKGEGKHGKMEGFGKFMACVWEKQGILEGDSINKEKFTESCKKLFPINGQKIGETVSQKCFNNVHGLNKDEISTFKDVFMCVHTTMGEVCPEMKKGHHGHHGHHGKHGHHGHHGKGKQENDVE